MMRPTQILVHWLVVARWPLLGLAIVLAALAYWPSRQVRFDRRIERMFAPSDPLLGPFERLGLRFGASEIVLVVYSDADLLAADGSGLRRLALAADKLQRVPGVRDVLSLSQIDALLTRLESTQAGAGAFLNLPVEQPRGRQGPAVLNPDNRLAASFRKLFEGYTHSADGRTAAIVCLLDAASNQNDEGRASRKQTLDGLRAVARELPGGVLAGEPVMVDEGFALLEDDGSRLSTWSTLLLGLTILILFRSVRWLLVPIAIVQWTLVVTQALLVVLALELTMVSSMLAAIVTVVGVATVMHLIVRYRELCAGGLASRDALISAGSQLAGPICGAILTDAAGFGALMFAGVEPVRDFGLMMVVGSLLVLPATCLLVPALVLVGAGPARSTPPAWGEGWLGDILMRSVDWIRLRPRTVAAVTIVVSVLASIGTARLKVETDFTRNFRRGSSIAAAYEFVETRLGGAGVWDVVIPAPAILDAHYVARVRQLEDRLRALTVADPTTGQRLPALTKVISLVDVLDAVQSEPLLAGLTPQPELRTAALAKVMPTFVSALRSAEPDEFGQGRLRIMLRSRERLPAAEKQRLIEEVTRLSQAEFSAGQRSSGAEVTGFFVLLTNLIQSVIRDQLLTFAVASAAIATLVWIGFGSWRYALIALIPNAVPIYMVMGVLGWLGLAMNMGTAMIAAVSMGMSVDSSIHYFSAFRRARREGKSVHESLLVCQRSVGSAMIFSTVALIVGFGVLVTSQFVPTIYFGALMSLAMLSGMLGNLIVLPLLLSWIERDHRHMGEAN